MGLRDFGHGSEVIKNGRKCCWPCIPSNVVDARQDHHSLGFKVYDIGFKTNQHLRGGLSTNSPIDIGVVFKKIQGGSVSSLR